MFTLTGQLAGSTESGYFQVFRKKWSVKAERDDDDEKNIIDERVASFALRRRPRRDSLLLVMEESNL
jgi:hypothetical protein